MKKILTISLLSATLLLTGCTNSGLGVNPSSGATVKQAFEIGTIQSSQKVLIDEGSMNTTLTGAGIGAVGGALIGSAKGGKNAAVGGLIGAGVGALAGFAGGKMANNNEVEAYEVTIKSENGRIYRTYIKNDLPAGTRVEFLVREDGTVTNIDVKKPGKSVN